MMVFLLLLAVFIAAPCCIALHQDRQRQTLERIWHPMR